MKHGLTGQGVVVPGEDEHEITIRVAALEDQLVPEGDVVAALLVRQVAIASIRVERAYRHETALAAERMRRAGDVYNDRRHSLVEDLLEDLGTDPPTARRRLMMAPEGVDALLGRLHGLREKADPRRFVAWDAEDGEELDRCLGQARGRSPLSRVGRLSRGIGLDHWDGLDPAEHAHLDERGRTLWAVGEIHKVISAAITHLEAHKATLDPTRAERGHAEAAERALLDLGSEGMALRRYSGAAERSMLKLLTELRTMRREAEDRAVAAVAAPEVKQVLATSVPQMAEPYEVRDELGSFCLPPLPYRRPAAEPAVGALLTDLKAAHVPVTIGQVPKRPIPPAP